MSRLNVPTCHSFIPFDKIEVRQLQLSLVTDSTFAGIDHGLYAIGHRPQAQLFHTKPRL